MPTWKERARVFHEILAKEGYRPEIDADDDIHFKSEGYNYWILGTDDEQFVQITLPNFWSIEDDDELGRALLAASAVSRGIKIAKVYARGDLADMFITAEQFLARDQDLAVIIDRLIGTVRAARDMFSTEMTNSA
jgi:hypothetical protein